MHFHLAVGGTIGRQKGVNVSQKTRVGGVDLGDLIGTENRAGHYRTSNLVGSFAGGAVGTSAAGAATSAVLASSFGASGATGFTPSGSKRPAVFDSAIFLSSFSFNLAR